MKNSRAFFSSLKSRMDMVGSLMVENVSPNVTGTGTDSLTLAKNCMEQNIGVCFSYQFSGSGSFQLK